jgi:hypothetical protein
MRPLRASIAAIALALALALPGGAAAQGYPQCFGETEADNVQPQAGKALRFGITPGIQTGQLGTGEAVPRTPEDPDRHLAELAKLRPPGGPFVLRLHRFFWSDGEPAVQRFLALTDRYTRAGYLVELQLRYHPDAQQEGDIAAWAAHVRDVVRRFGSNKRVVAIQVTNEVNLTFSPDSSDGSYAGARDALIQGVIAAKDEARKRGYSQLEIGFNWAYRTAPQDDASFWNYIRDHGGAAFTGALDWVGLDAYPGTFFPPAETPGDERDGMVNAMSAMRCFTQGAGIPDSKPIHVEETGFPTDQAARSEARQAQVADTIVRAVHDFRGNYNVSDLRWFNLRDGNSQSGNYQTQYGLLRDDYTEKPAFGVFARLVGELSIRDALGPEQARPDVHLRTRCAGTRIRASLVGRDTRLARRVEFRDGRLRARDARRPFVRILGRGRRQRIAAVVRMRDGERLMLRLRSPRCGAASRPSLAG